MTAPATDRMHRAVSEDGTAIVGRVVGEGPPLVLVHGAVADGESEWATLVPLLTDRFTCYLPSLRGRGLSDAHPDVTREARVRDVAAFVASIGEPVGLVGASGGGMVSLGAAARSPAVAALGTLEAVVPEAMDPPSRGRFLAAIESMAEGVTVDRPIEAVLEFLGFAANDEEVAALSDDSEGMDELAAYLPLDIAEIREAFGGEGYSPTAPAVLARITAPTLLLHGTRTSQRWFTDSTLFAGRHIPDATVRAIEGNGHFGHLVAPERVAAELIPFFSEKLRRGDG